MSAVYTAIKAWLKELIASLCVVQSITGQGKTERQETRQHNTRICCYLLYLYACPSISLFSFSFFHLFSYSCHWSNMSSGHKDSFWQHLTEFQKYLFPEEFVFLYWILIERRIFFVYLAPQCALKYFTFFHSHRQSNTVGRGHHPRCHLLIRNSNH